MAASIERARALKASGNQLFGERVWSEAVAAYSEALAALAAPTGSEELEPAARELRVALLSNRAACFLSLEEHSACVEDASAALKLDPAHPKARFRRARALAGLGRTRDALRDLQELLLRLRRSPSSSSSSSASASASSKAATRLLVELQQKLKEEEAGGRDRVGPALELLRDKARPLRVLEQQCRVLTAAVRTSEEWVRQLAQRGAVVVLWELACREKDAVQPLVTLAALAAHARLHREFLALDWTTVMKQQLLHAPPLAAKPSPTTSNTEDAADVVSVPLHRLRAVLQLWCTVVVPDPAAEEKALFEAKAGPASVDAPALMATVSDFEKSCLLGIRRCLAMSVEGDDVDNDVDQTRRAAVDAVIRVTSLPRLVRCVQNGLGVPLLRSRALGLQ